MVDHIVLATHNPGKIREYKKLFIPFNLKITTIAEILEEPEESGETFTQNALIKAKFYAQHFKYKVLAEDSGLVIPSLDGHPGIYSARWAKACGGYEQAFEELKIKLKNLDNSAFFECSIVVYDPIIKDNFVFTGRCFGNISFPAKGQYGFGYDPIFIPTGEHKTMSQLGLKYKQFYSHRVQAFKKLVLGLSLTESYKKDKL